ncbi:uncharacterized protein LOC111064665 [Drosophila obscura]|uniref:uncharacterized protein LOC111064665 n=1 Tax=Drosophila obscura TaxID=7282 RepID=UPI001BB258F2|nr:uncharacterized protein LOC111064665 [Drosophila obscura]
MVTTNKLIRAHEMFDLGTCLKRYMPTAASCASAACRRRVTALQVPPTNNQAVLNYAGNLDTQINGKLNANYQTEKQHWFLINQNIIYALAKLLERPADVVFEFLYALTLQNFGKVLNPLGHPWSACQVPLSNYDTCDYYNGIFDSQGNLRDPKHHDSLRILIQILQSILRERPDADNGPHGSLFGALIITRIKRRRPRRSRAKRAGIGPGSAARRRSQVRVQASNQRALELAQRLNRIAEPAKWFNDGGEPGLPDYRHCFALPIGTPTKALGPSAGKLKRPKAGPNGQNADHFEQKGAHRGKEGSEVLGPSAGKLKRPLAGPSGQSADHFKQKDAHWGKEGSEVLGPSAGKLKRPQAGPSGQNADHFKPNGAHRGKEGSDGGLSGSDRRLSDTLNSSFKGKLLKGQETQNGKVLPADQEGGGGGGQRKKPKLGTSTRGTELRSLIDDVNKKTRVSNNLETLIEAVNDLDLDSPQSKDITKNKFLQRRISDEYNAITNPLNVAPEGSSESAKKGKGKAKRNRKGLKGDGNSQQKLGKSDGYSKNGKGTTEGDQQDGEGAADGSAKDGRGSADGNSIDGKGTADGKGSKGQYGEGKYSTQMDSDKRKNRVTVQTKPHYADQPSRGTSFGNQKNPLDYKRKTPWPTHRTLEDDTQKGIGKKGIGRVLEDDTQKGIGKKGKTEESPTYLKGATKFHEHNAKPKRKSGKAHYYYGAPIPVLVHEPFDEKKSWTWLRRHPQQNRIGPGGELAKAGTIRRYRRSSVERQMVAAKTRNSVHSVYSNVSDSAFRAEMPMFGEIVAKRSKRSSVVSRHKTRARHTQLNRTLR